MPLSNGMGFYTANVAKIITAIVDSYLKTGNLYLPA